jgi:outer membrane protein insertion porin family
MKQLAFPLIYGTSGRRYIYPAMFLFLLTLLASGCSVYKYVPESQKLVVKNKVVVTVETNEEPAKPIAIQLQNLIEQAPNTKVLGLFRTYLWIHYRNKKANKDNRYRRFLESNLAEKPVYLEANMLDDNLENMLIYLKNQGYFQATGTYDVKIDAVHPVATVTYTLSPGHAIRIKTADIRSADPSLNQWLPELNKRSSLRPGMIIKSETYSKEVNRITDFLRNNGYAFFYPNQISPFQVASEDTAQHIVNVYIELLSSADKKTSTSLTIGDVLVQTALKDNQPMGYDTIYQGIHIQDEKKKPFINPDVLFRAMDLKPDSLYKESRFTRTNRRLSMLGVYRFVNIRSQQDTSGKSVNLDIQLTPANRSAIELGAEANNTTAVGDNSNVLGLALSSSVSSRNLFRRAIRMEFTLEPSVETNLDPLQVNALNGNAKMKFQFPFFEDYFWVWEKSKLSKWYPQLWDDARSQASVSFTYNNLLNFWETQYMNVNYGFEYNPTPSLKVTLDHFQADYYRNILKDGFKDSAPEGSELAFQNQFLTGFLFRSINGVYNAPPNRYGETWGFRGGFEQSGLEILGLNSMARIFDPNTPFWKAGDIRFAKYLRGEGQWTYARNFGGGRVGVTRIGGGLIVPLADSPSSPYLKQFAVGGPSSMRGWLNGQLGPGSYRNINKDRPPYFQRGDLRLEANIEWRQKIFWILEGALFFDAGNVWTLKETDEQPGGGLRDMHKEWALAGGAGIRLNFNFFVIVYDVGAKLRYPYQVNGSYWAKKPELNFLNLLINYPF